MKYTAYFYSNEPHDNKKNYWISRDAHTYKNADIEQKKKGNMKKKEIES